MTVILKGWEIKAEAFNKNLRDIQNFFKQNRKANAKVN